MPAVDLFGGLARKSDRPAIGTRSSLTVNRLGDEKRAGARAIHIATAALVIVVPTFTCAEYAQHGIVELLGFLQILEPITT